MTLANQIAIRAEGLGKQFHIGRALQNDRALPEALLMACTAPFRRAARLLGGHASAAAELDETIWALRNISLEIRRGEVVGIIGRNGAGKSTLLKILSCITEPTEGFTEIHGRVGALLEVGTGFHPELTGRENIYLNGAILGMKRAEIDRKFDEIVAFAEVERFIDTPVKHYSSGMQTRLGFAVAAHLEPEILIVDEVLAVGDARFQKKCLNKMQDVGQQGRTVLFVSHNMSAITRLCERAILVEEGRILHDGPSSEVVAAYLASGLGTTAAREWPDSANAPGSEVAWLCAVRARGQDGRISDAMDIRRAIAIEMEYEVLRPEHMLVPRLTFANDEGLCLFVSSESDGDWTGRRREPGRYVSTAWIPGNLLTEGMMFVGAALLGEHPHVVHAQEEQAVAFQVIDSLEGDSARGDYGGRMGGSIRPLLEWNTQYTSEQGEAAVMKTKG